MMLMTQVEAIRVGRGKDLCVANNTNKIMKRHNEVLAHQNTEMHSY